MLPINEITDLNSPELSIYDDYVTSLKEAGYTTIAKYIEKYKPVTSPLNCLEHRNPALQSYVHHF